jgi:hypothetical protein
MTYIINAKGGTVAAGSFQRETAVEAIEKAMELIGRGLSDVVILAPDGKAYKLSDFPLLLKNGS